MIAAMDRWHELAAALNRTMTSQAPGWTERNDADPGVTVLEVIAYLAEDLLVHARGPKRDVGTAARAIAALERYHSGSPHVETSAAFTDKWSGTKRPRYFTGRLLSASDLAEEQNYHVESHRRHLRTLHGSGIVHGLEAGLNEQGTAVTIVPGLAIDASGREIQLTSGLTLALPNATASPVLVVVEYRERFVDPAPVGQNGAIEPVRVEEGCRVAFVATPCDECVAVARLVDTQGQWRVDPAFVPTYVRQQA